MNYKTASPNCHAHPIIGIHLIDFFMKTFELFKFGIPIEMRDGEKVGEKLVVISG